jgi:hypothetical protein
MYIHGYHFVSQEALHLRLAAVGLQALATHLATAALGDEQPDLLIRQLDQRRAKLQLFMHSLHHDLARWGTRSPYRYPPPPFPIPIMIYVLLTHVFPLYFSHFGTIFTVKFSSIFPFFSLFIHKASLFQ